MRTFKAVDNQRMAVRGKYTLIESGNVRFEIFDRILLLRLLTEQFLYKGKY